MKAIQLTVDVMMNDEQISTLQGVIGDAPRTDLQIWGAVGRPLIMKLEGRVSGAKELFTWHEITKPKEPNET